MLNKLLTVTEVTEILRIKKSTIYRWVWAKINLPYYKVGNKVLFKQEDIDRYLEKNKVEIS